MNKNIKMAIISFILLATFSFVFGQSDSYFHPLKASDQDKIISQLKSIESAMHFENRLLLREIYREYFDALKTVPTDRDGIIKKDFFDIFLIKQKKGYVKNFAERIVLNILSFEKDQITVEAELFGTEKLSLKKTLSYRMTGKKYIEFSYQDLTRLYQRHKSKITNFYTSHL